MSLVCVCVCACVCACVRACVCVRVCVTEQQQLKQSESQVIQMQALQEAANRQRALMLMSRSVKSGRVTDFLVKWEREEGRGIII